MGDEEGRDSIRLLVPDEARYLKEQQYSNGTNGGAAVGVTKNRLGTIMGVYIPTCLGIFGVVIFLRLSWITGQTGMFNRRKKKIIRNIRVEKEIMNSVDIIYK